MKPYVDETSNTVITEHGPFPADFEKVWNPPAPSTYPRLISDREPIAPECTAAS